MPHLTQSPSALAATLKETQKVEERRPIDKIRESAGQADIGTSEDGAIVEAVKIGERLLFVKEKSIYEFMLADAVDPQRTNINLPSNIHKLIINQGSESEMVSRTFLTAKTLFRPEFFDKEINTQKVLELSLEILEELVILEKEISEYLEQERKVSDEYERRRTEKASYSIPSVVNLETRCKTIFQKVDHIEQILMEIITVFYPKDGLTKQSHFPKFYDVLKGKYSDSDHFAQFIDKALYFMKVVRALRNALDHRLNTVFVRNFELQLDGNVLTPTIELKHKDEKLERVSLSHFLPIVLQNLISIIEISFAHLAAKHGKDYFLGSEVREIPEEKRRYKFVRYSFWSPIGEGGYYNQ